MFRAAKFILVFVILLNLASTFSAQGPSESPALARVKAENLNSEAVRLIASQQYEPAIRVLSEAVETDPLFPDARVNLGTAYTLTNRADVGLVHIKRSLELDPKSPVAHNQLGVAYESLGKYSAAIEAFQRSLQLRPKYALAYFNLGKIYLIQKDLKRAEAAFEKGLELDPSRDQERLYLAVAYAHRSRFADAIGVARSVAQKYPGNENANLMLCRLYILNKDRDSALRMYQSFKSTNVGLADRMFESIFGEQILDASAVGKQ